MQDSLTQTTSRYEELSKTYAETTDRLKDANDRNYELEIEIKKLKDKIEDLELDIKSLKEKEEELRQVQAQNYLIQEKIDMLEKHIAGAEVQRGDKQYINRGVQVKPQRQTDCEV